MRTVACDIWHGDTASLSFGSGSNLNPVRTMRGKRTHHKRSYSVAGWWATIPSTSTWNGDHQPFTVVVAVNDRFFFSSYICFPCCHRCSNRGHSNMENNCGSSWLVQAEDWVVHEIWFALEGTARAIKLDNGELIRRSSDKWPRERRGFGWGAMVTYRGNVRERARGVERFSERVEAPVSRCAMEEGHEEHDQTKTCWSPKPFKVAADLLDCCCLYKRSSFPCSRQAARWTSIYHASLNSFLILQVALI